METLQHLIGYFIKLAFGLFFCAFTLWLVSLFFPGLSFKNVIPSSKGTSTAQKVDWLPAPKAYQGLFKRTPGKNAEVYVHGGAFNGYGDMNNSQYTYSHADYVSYTDKGMVLSNGELYDGEISAPSGEKEVTNVTGTSSKVLYVRNLSIYQGSAVSSGLSFVGEARSTMFQNGHFPIVLIDNNRRVIGISTAVATPDWTVPGWTKFQTRISHPVAYKGVCTLIFEEALAPGITRAPTRVPLLVTCK